jgi:hypothetical protein
MIFKKEYLPDIHAITITNMNTNTATTPKSSYRKEKSKINYFRRKLIFWSVVIAILLTSALLVVWFIFAETVPKSDFITVGICGEVKSPAVYTIDSRSDLSVLIYEAGGLTADADFKGIDFELRLLNDSIYHIPAAADGSSTRALQDSLLIDYWQSSSSLAEPDSQYYDSQERSLQKRGTQELGMNSFLYVGFPALFVLIDYYPEIGRVTITHIPHTTLFLDTDHRLIDIFFLMGPDLTMQMLQKRLSLKIDSYIIQDRASFIAMIDYIEGIDVKIDSAFAQQYNQSAREVQLNGEMAWEYVKFMDMRRINRKIVSDSKLDVITHDNFSASNNEWQLAYETRHHRQKLVMNGLRKKFLEISDEKKITFLANMAATLETDIKTSQLLDIYRKMLGVPDFSYNTLPGYYESRGENLYYVPDVPSFELLKNDLIRSYLKEKNDKKYTIY